MPRIHFEIVTPERTVFSDEVDAATIPTREGEITVLPNHLPLVGILAPGAVRLKKGPEEQFLAVSTGYLEVRPDNRLMILADSAERAEELELAKIEEAKERARRVMNEKKGMDEVAYAAAAAVLERELARLKVARRRAPRAAPVIKETETDQSG